MNENSLTERQIQILEFIDSESRERGFPPSVREICKAVGLTSPSTVHAHLASLQKLGYLRRSDPGKPRAIEVCFDPISGAAIDRGAVQHVPLVGDVAAGVTVFRQENIEESLPLPAELINSFPDLDPLIRGDWSAYSSKRLLRWKEGSTLDPRI